MKELKMPMGIILTGGIATGKSSVAKILRECGYEVLDSDAIAHRALEIKRNEIIGQFGEGILDSGQISRVLLGKIVFHSKEAREALESIVHPYIFTEIDRKAREFERLHRPYFLDIPLYFETNQRYLAKSIWCVACNEETQLMRLMARNSLTKEEAMARIKAQMPLSQKIQRSDVVIENNSTLADLEDRVRKAIERLS